MPDTKNDEAKDVKDAAPTAAPGDVVIKSDAVSTTAPVKLTPDPPQDTLPQLHADGRVRVNQAISDEAVAEGHGADVQPKAQPAPTFGPVPGVDREVMDSSSGVLSIASDKIRKQAAEDFAARQAAMEQLTAQLSVKVENAAQGDDAASIAPDAKPAAAVDSEVAKVPSGTKPNEGR